MRLLEAFTFSTLRLANRLVIALRETDVLQARALDAHALRWSRAGLAISPPLAVEPCTFTGGRPTLVDETDVSLWRAVTARVHAASGGIIALLSHAPSPLTPTGDVIALAEMFTASAALARQAGFDGVELQVSPALPIDCCGVAGHRGLALLEIAEAIAAVWSVDSIGVRLSPWSTPEGVDHPLETALHLAAALDQLGLGYLHVIEPQRRHDAVLTRLRGQFGGAILAGGTHTPDRAEALLGGGLADLVAFADVPPWLVPEP